MEPLILYSRMMEDLIYSTKADEFLEKVKGRTELVALLALKNIDCIAPVLSMSEREKLYRELIKSPVVRFAPSFNVRNTEVILPAGADYERMKEISVDEFNLVRIIIMINDGFFPNLTSLKFFTDGTLTLNTSRLSNLRSLTLINMSDRKLTLPDIDGLDLDELSLNGYVLGFLESLPKKLSLEQCIVQESANLLGCEEMRLIETDWKKQSVPSTSLYMEKGVLNKRLPDKLIELYLIDSKVEERAINYRDLKELRVLRLDNVQTDSDPPVDFVKARTITSKSKLQELIISSSEKEINIPDSVITLRMKDTIPSNFGENIRVAEFVKINENLKLLLDNLVKVEELYLIECTFGDANIIESDFIPISLTKMRFIRCTADGIKIDPPNGLRELVVIGKSPDIIIDKSTPPSLKWLHSLTNTLLMDLREFRLFCVDKLNRGIFMEYEHCTWDILNGRGWKTRTELISYLSIISQDYPFIIPRPERGSVGLQIVNKGNTAMRIKIGNSAYTIDYLRRTKNEIERDIENFDFSQMNKDVGDFMNKILRSS